MRTRKASARSITVETRPSSAASSQSQAGHGNLERRMRMQNGETRAAFFILHSHSAFRVSMAQKQNAPATGALFFHGGNAGMTSYFLPFAPRFGAFRSEERRVGKECRSRW